MANPLPAMKTVSGRGGRGRNAVAAMQHDIAARWLLDHPASLQVASRAHVADRGVSLLSRAAGPIALLFAVAGPIYALYR